jgi:predicted nucleic acid-binding protein
VAAPAHLVDSNILLRIARRDDPDHAIVDAALSRLAEGGAILYYTHQNIAEFWNVATRPADRNGFGLTVTQAERETRVIERGWCSWQTARPCTTSGAALFSLTRSPA